MEQMVLTVCWMPEGKRWLVSVRADTASGHLYLTRQAEDPYGVPLLEATARQLLDGAAALMGGQYPW